MTAPSVNHPHGTDHVDDPRPTTNEVTAVEAQGHTRRQVLITGAAVIAATAVTAACGSSGSPAATSPAAGTSDSSSPAATGSGATVKTTDIPVGGGEILTAQKIVVTQPTAGVFKAFTAVCTHMGCTVASVSNGIIQCPCHGSQYSIVDGSVKGGPAPAPLAAIPLTVAGTTITVA